ncbi:MAG: gamma-glutamylcyclotransferase [Methylovulum sp.]|uniref:gamma-glutamylcyclotransferase family protein n=1 Tax=Methylovulum sp. TaxID=1916980 RepID=UPI002630CD88|nr:gamma-glutamylcyclotransferase family protein [Methylovulum sp.]MDD2723739.1 gamma-glutamylcyclotransferase [Methylovulum sp.]MDD5125356.1 gamma-glutamylcyclotransferase [Methylovulum sp.]
MPEFFFAYGTLRNGINSPMSAFLANNTVYLSQAFMRGQLVDVGQYPGAIESIVADDKVWGEVYQILNAGTLFAKLDDYEECSARFAKPHEYVRKAVPVYLDNGKVLMAWCYIYNFNTDGLKRIESGDYRDII